jgi:predicted Zn-dependent protease
MIARWRRISIVVAASTLLSAAAGARAQAPTDLPDIGSPASSVLTQNEEYQIGAMVLRQLREQGQVLDDPETTEYLQSLGARIGAHASGENGQRFQFFVVRDPTINAFALPGGFIGVNHGLILTTTNEAQLASVLAHEIAHVTQRHIARRLQAQGRQSMAAAAAMLAALIIGATTGASGDVMQGAIAMSQGMAAQQSINFTRANEYEADRVGIGFLAAAGFDPNAMPDFFETMGRRAGLAGRGVPELLRSHPVTTNRIAESRSRALQLSPVVQTESLSYQLARERLRVIAGPSDSDVRPYYEARRQARSLTVGERYGAALAALAAGQTLEALSEFETLALTHAQIPMIQSTFGEAQLRAGNEKAALNIYERALAISPRNVPLTVRYAEALLKTGNPKAAHSLLLDLFNNVPPTPEQIRFTALAASAAGDIGDAYYYMSEYHIAGGDLQLSAKQLELALASPNLNNVQRGRFQARLDEVREVLARDRRRAERRDPVPQDPP